MIASYTLNIGNFLYYIAISN